MSYELRLSPRAQSDFEKLKKSGNVSALRKLQQIFLELMDHPLTGIGQPERLKNRPDTYSRRLTKKDRVVYTVHEVIVTVDVVQVLEHYADR